MNYQLTTVAFFVGCLMTAVIILFLLRKGVMLMEIFKTLDAIGRLNRSFKEEQEKNEQLSQKVELLEKENEDLKAKQKKQDERINNLEEISEIQRKNIRDLAAADRDLDEWKEMMYQTLSAISDLSPELIFKLTGRKKGDTNGPL